MIIYGITEKDHCRRVESFLRNILPAAPLPYLNKLVKNGHVAINGVPPLPGGILMLGDTLTLKESSRTKELLSNDRPELDILFEDDQIVVFDKPPGLPVHKTAEDAGRDLVALGEQFMATRGITVKLRPVNRLDRGTSGATIMAKSSTSAGMFGRFVKEVGLGKLYLAMVDGEMPSEGVISTPLDGKASETFYRVLFQGEEGALAALWPISGRTHQIRKHLQSIGHPVRGDRRYGGTPLAGYDGHALHAFRVALRHPGSGKELVISAPLPEELVVLMKELTGDACSTILRSLPSLPLEYSPQ